MHLRKAALPCSLFCLSLFFVSGCHNDQDSQRGPAHSSKQAPNQSPANALLKKVIERDRPQLTQKGLSDWQRTNELREWVHENSDYALSSDIANDDVYEAYKDKSVADLFGDYFNDELAVWCYGTANSYVRVCQLFGYQAYVMNIGWNDDPNVSTHAVALVSVKVDGKKRWALQDADYNYTLVDKNNALLDFPQAISLLKQKRHEEVYLLQGKAKAREMIATMKQTKGSSWVFSQDASEPKLARRTRKGHYVYKGQGTLKEFSSSFLTGIYERHLKATGYPKDIRYIFLFPFEVKNSKVGRNMTLFNQIKIQAGAGE